MALDTRAIQDRIVSHAMATGCFDKVNGFEPKSAPGTGVTAGVWVQNLAPARGASGLATTTLRLIFTVRIYTSMLSEPLDAIDPAITDAASVLCAAYSGDFDLGGQVRNVDLLGEYSDGLGAVAGYVNIDGKLMRIMDVSLPLVINDVWTQGA